MENFVQLLKKIKAISKIFLEKYFPLIVLALAYTFITVYVLKSGLDLYKIMTLSDSILSKLAALLYFLFYITIAIYVLIKRPKDKIALIFLILYTQIRY